MSEIKYGLRKKKIWCVCQEKIAAWLRMAIGKDMWEHGAVLRRPTRKNRRGVRKWDGLTISTAWQMLDSKLLERLQGDANGLTKAMAWVYIISSIIFHLAGRWNVVGKSRQLKNIHSDGKVLGLSMRQIWKRVGILVMAVDYLMNFHWVPKRYFQ